MDDAASRPIVRALAQPMRDSAAVVHEIAGSGQLGTSHVCVDVLHVIPAPQSPSPRQPTHVADEPWSRHRGVGLPHGAQAAPHAASDAHRTHVPDTHCEPALQSPLTRQSTHPVAAALHTSPCAVQFAQEAPHRASTLHGTQAEPLHHRPDGQSPSFWQALHELPAQPKGHTSRREVYWHAPPEQVPGASKTRRLVASAHVEGGGLVQVIPMQGFPVHAPLAHPCGQATVADA